MLTEALNPLRETHAAAEAEFQAYGEVTEIVTTFGEPQAEYAAIRKACAMIDLPQRTIIELTGKDRLPFLNNLLSNNTWDKQTKIGLTAGTGVYAFLLNIKGRIVADLNVIERGDRTLLELDARLAGMIKTTFDKYLFTEQVKIEDRSGVLHEIALHGPGAAGVIEQTSGTLVASLEPIGSTSLRMFDRDLVVWRDDVAGIPGFHLIMPNESARVVWMNLLSRFSTAQELGKRVLRPAGWAAFNATRIEAGRPNFGIDFDDTILPAETGPATFARAVSLTKCYVGQEIVARMHARGQVAKQIVGIRMTDDALPIAGAQVTDDQSNVVGGITSSTISPVLSNAAICMGIVKKPCFNVGTILNIPAEGAMRKGTVVQLPFLPATQA
jgi:folate-binding protein YgfZ